MIDMTFKVFSSKTLLNVLNRKVVCMHTAFKQHTTSCQLHDLVPPNSIELWSFFVYIVMYGWYFQSNSKLLLTEDLVSKSLIA